jgi:hypothetical protein
MVHRLARSLRDAEHVHAVHGGCAPGKASRLVVRLRVDRTKP